MIMRIVVSTILGLGLIASANAQNRPSQDKSAEGWSISAGGGAILSPTYLGDDAYGLSLVPSIRVEHGDRFFAAVETGTGYALINNKTLRAGPLITLDFGRDEDGDGPFQVAGATTQDLIGLGDIDTTVSLGGFAELLYGDFTISIKGGQALGGHDGMTGELGVSYGTRLQGNGPPLILSMGPRLKFGDDDYASALFGVTAIQSAGSGLPQYTASGGIISYGASGTVIMPVTKQISLTFLTSYDRLSKDIADAPLVRLRGDADQAFMGVVGSYRFK